MPLSPPRPCATPGCAALTRARWCERHAAAAEAERKAFDRERGSASARGYDGKWRQARAAFLARHPLCVECQRHGLTVAATVVDHHPPHRGDMKAFWDRARWRALCQRCHNAKSAGPAGAFGPR